MTSIHAFAPGKLVLIGEYAVLDGASALVMAVDRQVSVKVSHARRRVGCLHAPQLGIRRAAMAIDHGALCCPDQSHAGLGLTARMVPGILRELGHDVEEIRQLDLEIDSGELFETGLDGPVKLGLGSSAAVSAALALALAAWFESGRGERFPDPEALLQRWLPVYRAALGGRASGADLAAAFSGGLSEFRIWGERGHCRAVQWPEGLYWQAVWVGHAAQTADYVAAYERWKRAEPEAAKGIGRRLGQVAQQAVACSAEPVALIAACGEYAKLLAELGDAMGMQVMSAPHRRLARLGRDCGVVYKSCGAGGGDLGIALATDPDRLGAFATRISDSDAVPLDFKISKTGARITVHPKPRAGAKT